MRLLLPVLAAAVFLLATVHVVAGQFEERSHTVGIGSLDLLVGEEGAVDLVVFDEPDPGFGAWNISITYDPDVLTSVTCTAHEGGTCEHDSLGALHVSGANADGLTGDVTLATLAFSCDAPGISALAIDAVVSVTSIPEVVDTVEVREGRIACQTEPQPVATPSPVSLPSTGTGSGGESLTIESLLPATLAAAVGIVASGLVIALGLRRMVEHDPRRRVK